MYMSVLQGEDFREKLNEMEELFVLGKADQGFVYS